MYKKSNSIAAVLGVLILILAGAFFFNFGIKSFVNEEFTTWEPKRSPRVQSSNGINAKIGGVIFCAIGVIFASSSLLLLREHRKKEK